jgi:hypothetical protein
MCLRGYSATGVVYADSRQICDHHVDGFADLGGITICCDAVNQRISTESVQITDLGH